MLSKKAIKDIQSLKQKKSRQESGLFVAEGSKLVAEILEEIPHLVQHLYATKDWIHQHKTNPAVTVVTGDELKRLSSLETPNAVLAVVQQVPVEKPVHNNGLIIYLDRISDPGNLGSIIRIGDWFNCTAVVCSVGCADKYNAKVVQASMGSLLRVPVWYEAEDEDWLSDRKESKLAATLAGNNVYKMKVSLPAILMIGSEAHGLSAEKISRATDAVSIPGKGGAESLNAAVAAGILVAELTNGNG